MPQVISIVGRKNSGKTTLVEKLVAALRRRGHRVGTVKHDVHGFQMDHEGKDTHRHFEAGAEAVVIFTDTHLALNRRLDMPVGLDEAIAQYMPDVDIVVTEGFKSGAAPKIEVWRAALGHPPLDPRPGGIVAVATDDAPPYDDAPALPLNDAEAIADFVESL